jgi:ferritin-like metal-binding protein YciE
MRITRFHDMYVAELQELCNMEEQLADALEHAVEIASDRDLKSALKRYRDETKLQRKRLEVLLEERGAEDEHTDQAMEALLRETDKMMEMLQGDELKDAGLIASVQKLKHYEIAAYGTAAALAGQLDLRDEQRMLHQTLEEEKQADALLTHLAKAVINQAAVRAAA